MPTTIAKHGFQDPSVQQAMKVIYDEAYDTISKVNPLSAQLEKTKKVRRTGFKLEFNVKVAASGAVSNQGDGTGPILPRASTSTRVNGESKVVVSYATFLAGGQLQELAREKTDSFVDQVQELVADTVERLARDVEIQRHLDGTGIRAIVETTDSGTAPTVIGVTRPGNVGASVVQGPGVMYLRGDMDLAVINPANGTEKGRFTVSRVVYDNETLEVGARSSTFAIAPGDYLVLCNDVGAVGDERSNNYLNESVGLLAAVNNTGIFEGINASTYDRWRSEVITNSGAPVDLDEATVQTLESRIKANSAGMDNGPDIYYTTQGIINRFRKNLLTAYGTTDLKRWDGNSIGGKTIKAGYRAELELNGTPVLEGWACPKGHFFGLKTSGDAVGMMQAGSKNAMAKLGSITASQAPFRDAWYEFIRYYHQFVVFRRDCHFVIKNLNDDTTIVRRS